MLNLTKIMKEQNLSLSELSRRSGIVLPRLSQLAAAKSYPWPKYKEQLEKVLGVPGEILFKEVEDEADDAKQTTA
jgi:transcriptional regulator with XRE-family HTH domain